MHKIWSHLLMNSLLMMALPFVANAAGTYYTGTAYQPVQYRYGQTGSYTNGYGNNPTNSMASVRYNNYSRGINNVEQQSGAQRNTQQKQQSVRAGNTRGGFYANAGITHESAMWKMEMKKDANSILHYDNIAWNVLDVNGGYVFDLGKTKMQVDAGLKYGLQWGETTMVDDDITNGGFGVVNFVKDNTLVGSVMGHGLSIGTSKDGNMLGFNVGVGLTDFMKLGNVRITPSIGYRYMKYKLETKNNYGMLIYTVNGADGCVVGNGESQCGVALLFYENATDIIPAAVVPANYLLEITDFDSLYVDATDTYYYTQSGTSHSYEAAWSGPYIAMDMIYDINQYNSVNGRIELGFPGYKSTGDQPYRWDWAHPKSVEDSAGMFSAFHLGLGANWKTAITDSVALSIGMTYDYYTVSGADTKTYLNQTLYNELMAKTDKTTTDLLMIYKLEGERDSCGGWVCDSKKEIDSIYKSMGVRVGIDAQF